MRALACTTAATVALAVGAAHAATEPRIGAAAIATNSVTGTLGAAQRPLRAGDAVFRNEDIVTGANSRAQILFADETALTMGPNSQVQLDRFVYDPDKRSGQLGLRAVTGAFRLVTGSGPKDGYKISTGVGTIGVRGTTIEFVIRGRTLTLALSEGAAILCTLAGKCIELNVPGTYVIATADQIGDPKSKYGPACQVGGGASCTFGEGSDALFLQFLDLNRFSQLSPGSGPPTANGGQPGGGLDGAGFPPNVTGAGTIPQGLSNGLPPGLANNRGENFEPPGFARRNR
jgi:hypothetical protein